MSKIKYFVIGSTLAASIGGFFISGVSNKEIDNIAIEEGYTPKPIIPIKGDVPTIGNGTTIYPNGQRVKMSDPAITKQQARVFLKSHIDKDAVKFNQSLKNVKVSQVEYDLYMNFTYQYGITNWNNSSMLRNLKAGKYVEACKSLLKYKYAAKRDCSVRKNNCYGVWTRQLDRYNKCMAVN